MLIPHLLIMSVKRSRTRNKAEEDTAQVSSNESSSGTLKS